MAIGKPKAIDDAPAGRGPIAPVRWGGLRAGAKRRMAAERPRLGGHAFLPREEWANRGPHGAGPVGWKAQGKKVDPSAVASQAIEAQPSFGQIKPWRGRVVRTPNSILGRRRGGHRTSCTRAPVFQANEKETPGFRKDTVTTWQSVRDGAAAADGTCLCRPRCARQPERSKEGPGVPGHADERHSPHRNPTSSTMRTAQPHPSRVAPANGNDAGPPAPRRSTYGGTNSDIRAQAVPPTRTAPTIAKASRQPSDGTPIWASPNVAW